MLLRLCYLDVPNFYLLMSQNVDDCKSMMKKGFIKGFKLRRKGHTGKALTCLVSTDKGGQQKV